MALQAALRTGSINEACDDLLQTGYAYSEEEKQPLIYADKRIVNILKSVHRKKQLAS